MEFRLNHLTHPHAHTLYLPIVANGVVAKHIAPLVSARCW